MAKGNFNGILRGKLGNTVFYEIKNSNNSEKQGLRERKRVISNPQTGEQANQRMKLLPAMKIAAVLKSIIERGFEGVKYGTRSRLLFLKYALLMTEGYPYVEKDSPIVYPGRYMISRGSLPEITASLSAGDGLLSNLSCGIDLDDNTTIGEFTRELLIHNPQLNEGDQLTFIFGLGYEADDIHNSPVLYIQKSFYLNSDNTTTLLDAGLRSEVVFKQTSGYLSFENNESDFYAAFGCIQSRESTTGAHLRSTCKLLVSGRYDEMFGAATKATARKSYMKKNRSLNSDWPQVNTDEWEESGGGDITPVDSNFSTTTYMGVKNAAVLRSNMKVVSSAPVDIAGTETSEYTIAVFTDPSSKKLTVGGKVTVAWSATNKPAQISRAQATTLRSLGYTIPDQFVESE